MLVDRIDREDVAAPIAAILSRGYDGLDEEVRKAFESRPQGNKKYLEGARQWESDFVESLGIQDVSSVKSGSGLVDSRVGRKFSETVSKVLAQKSVEISFEDIEELVAIPQYLMMGEKTRIGSSTRFLLLQNLLENVVASELLYILPRDRPRYDKVLQYSAAFLLWSQKTGSDEGMVGSLLDRYKGSENHPL